VTSFGADALALCHQHILGELQMKNLAYPQNRAPPEGSLHNADRYLTELGGSPVRRPVAAKIVHCLLEFAGFHKFPSKKESKSCL
jgi:hypothetical protein